MKKRVTGILIAVALLSIAAAGITGAGAYFTDRVLGSQSHVIQLGDSTTVREETKDWNKLVTITNDATSAEAVWVRAQAFAPSDIQNLLEYGQGAGWTAGTDGWWYYGTPVEPGQAANTWTIQIPDQKVSPKEAEESATFNVIVVYETTPDTGTVANAQAAFAEAASVQSSQTGGNS